jgi:trehalose synthase
VAQEIDVPVRDPEQLGRVLPGERLAEFLRSAEKARKLLAGRIVWNVNSTARGGGVVELLRPLIGYARGAGVDTRWVVIEGNPGFFDLTKRIHNRLHGSPGDGGDLDERARRLYEEVLAENLADFAPRVQEGDVVILHDPQPAGLAPALGALAGAVIWRCHVGIDKPNDLAREAWKFLLPYVRSADVSVFSREAFVWEGIDRERVAIITPTIDVFTPKNEDLAPDTVLAVLRTTGLVAGAGNEGPVVFARQDGTPARVERRAEVVEDAPPDPETPLVVQVSRWDALKDPSGVIRGFAEHVPAETGAHLVYAGPAVEAVSDDPEGQRMLREALATRTSLPPEARSRVHLATLPMDDLDENALIVNALQRHARVVAQKSIAEGFGLTVAEAMWKARPVVASRVGGIQEQIEHGETGLLIDDPHDLEAFGRAVTELISDPQRAEEMGRRGRERVRDRFLSARSLVDYFTLIQSLLQPESKPRSRAGVQGRRRVSADMRR